MSGPVADGADLPRYDPPPGWEPGAPFWDALAKGGLAMPRCSACGRWQWYPDDGGADCPGAALVWEPVAGTGTVYTFTRVERSFLPGGRGSAPYLVGLIDLDGVDGPRLVANLAPSPTPTIGARARLETVAVGGRNHPVFVCEAPEERR